MTEQQSTAWTGTADQLLELKNHVDSLNSSQQALSSQLETLTVSCFYKLLRLVADDNITNAEQQQEQAWTGSADQPLELENHADKGANSDSDDNDNNEDDTDRTGQVNDDDEFDQYVKSCGLLDNDLCGSMRDVIHYSVLSGTGINDENDGDNDDFDHEFDKYIKSSMLLHDTCASAWNDNIMIIPQQYSARA